MSDDPKTIAINTSEVLERQRAAAGGDDDIPKTVAINAQELAERLEAERREAAAATAQAPSGASRAWVLPVAIAFVVLGGYLVFG